jgi:glyoxylase-like metal-dependent hydrolase (beta-lactamase superfamily II)
MAGKSIRIGDVEIIALSDGVYHPNLATYFPGHGPEDWADYPEFVDEQGNHRAPGNIGCYLVVSGDHKLLIDTGVGPGPVERWPGVEGNLLPTFREQSGYGPEDIDMVFTTHLHFDHVGWHVTRVNGELRAAFPNAKYMVPKTDWEALLDPRLPMTGPHKHDYSPGAAEVFQLSRPTADDLMAVTEVQTVSGDHQLTDQVVTVDTPGHTPGHQSLMVSAGNERAFIVGDAIHMPVQVNVPERVVGADVHPKLGAKTRTETVEWLEREGLLSAIGHFPAPGFGHIVRGKGKRYWQALGR